MITKVELSRVMKELASRPRTMTDKWRRSLEKARKAKSEKQGAKKT